MLPGISFIRLRNAFAAMAMFSSAALAAAQEAVAPATATTATRDLSTYILTPPAPKAPRVNGPSIFGVRPGSPLLYRIPATGERPMTYSATGLPKGLALDAATGMITGKLDAPATHTLTLVAKNALGQSEKQFRIVVGESIALTPPMGWNSYNVWGGRISEKKTLAIAKAMVDSGLIDHGWSYVNLDGGWEGRRGGEFNAIQPDERNFDDMGALASKIHAMGLKFGLYSSPWIVTYGGQIGASAENPEGTPQRWPPNVPKNQKQPPFAIGKFHFMEQDAKQYAAWGVDYLKFDWGPVEYPETKEMNDALRATGRDIVFSISNNHVKNLFPLIDQVSTVCNAWRTTTDIVDNWGRINDIGFKNDAWAPLSRPGHYNDADMLVVGMVGWFKDLHPTKLSPNQQYTHFTQWCMLASPLLLGCDLTQLDPFTLSLLTNDEVLAVNQDALCKAAVSVAKADSMEVYAKPMEDGSLAVALYNHAAEEGVCAVKWSDLKISGKRNVRDLWRQKDLGTFEDAFESVVSGDGVVLVRIAAAK